MKNLFALLLCALSIGATAQVNPSAQYQAALILRNNGEHLATYKLLEQLKPLCKPTDTLYLNVVWTMQNAAAGVAQNFRLQEQFDSALHYSKISMELLDNNKFVFAEAYNERAYWTHKNLLVAYYALGQFDNANREKQQLYNGYKKGNLPEGLNKFFNFDFFKWKDKNVWGYEWYEALPKDRNSKSFSKVVYYIYNTKPDGTDDEQAYRLQVLMFHKFDKSVKIDYVLTLVKDLEKGEWNRTLYNYTYLEKIDYQKLKKDIKKVLEEVDESMSKETNPEQH